MAELERERGSDDDELVAEFGGHPLGHMPTSRINESIKLSSATVNRGPARRPITSHGLVVWQQRHGADNARKATGKVEMRRLVWLDMDFDISV